MTEGADNQAVTKPRDQIRRIRRQIGVINPLHRVRVPTKPASPRRRELTALGRTLQERVNQIRDSHPPVDHE